MDFSDPNVGNKVRQWLHVANTYGKGSPDLYNLIYANMNKMMQDQYMVEPSAIRSVIENAGTGDKAPRAGYPLFPVSRQGVLSLARNQEFVPNPRWGQPNEPRGVLYPQTNVFTAGPNNGTTGDSSGDVDHLNGLVYDIVNKGLYATGLVEPYPAYPPLPPGRYETGDTGMAPRGSDRQTRF